MTEVPVLLDRLISELLRVLVMKPFEKEVALSQLNLIIIKFGHQGQ